MFKKKNFKEARFWAFIAAVAILLLFIFTQDAHQLEEPSNGGNITGKGMFFGFMVLAFGLLALWVTTALAKEFKHAMKNADQELQEIND